LGKKEDFVLNMLSIISTICQNKKSG